jgi:hypothetical protein
MKSLETKLAEAEQELKELRKTASKAGLTQQLSESGLPAPAQARLRKRFEATGSIDGLKTAVAEEHEYVRQVRKASGRNQGGRTTETQEGDAQRRRLFEGYRAFGLSEKEANLAAGIENAVEEIKESEQKLFDAAKNLGLSDAEAKAFSQPARSPLW